MILKPSACSSGECASTIELFRRENDDVFARTMGEVLGEGGDFERQLRRRGVVEKRVLANNLQQLWKTTTMTRSSARYKHCEV